MLPSPFHLSLRINSAVPFSTPFLARLQPHTIHVLPSHSSFFPLQPTNTYLPYSSFSFSRPIRYLLRPFSSTASYSTSIRLAFSLFFLSPSTHKHRHLPYSSLSSSRPRRLFSSSLLVSSLEQRTSYFLPLLLLPLNPPTHTSPLLVLAIFSA